MGWIGNLKRHRVTLVILSNLYADPAVKNIQPDVKSLRIVSVLMVIIYHLMTGVQFFGLIFFRSSYYSFSGKFIVGRRFLRNIKKG